jgi:hypothetical protein
MAFVYKSQQEVAPRYDPSGAKKHENHPVGERYIFREEGSDALFVGEPSHTQ